MAEAAGIAVRVQMILTGLRPCYIGQPEKPRIRVNAGGRPLA